MTTTRPGDNSHHSHAANNATSTSIIRKAKAAIHRRSNARLLATIIAIALVATILTTTAYMQTQKPSQQPVVAPTDKATLKQDVEQADSTKEATIEPPDAPALPVTGDYPLPSPFSRSTPDGLTTMSPNAPLAGLTGTKNIPGDYATLAAAVTDLNLNGVGSGGVTFNVIAANPQTAPAGGYIIGGAGSLVLTTSSAVNPITFTGNSNTVTAPNPQTSGNLNDAIFKLIGADFVTIQGFTMQENASNTTTATGTNNMTEWGVALLYVSLTDGSQNNTIQNNTISLNRTYLNTFGIYSNTRHSSTSMTTSAEVTAATGSNSNNKVYSNAISNINYGIVFIGAGAAAAIDTGNDIGGTSAATGNTITNWGGGAAPTGYVSLTGSNYCIFDNQQINDNVSFNTITSASLAQSVTTGGFLKNYSAGQPTGTITTTINNNTVTVTNNPSAATTGGIIGINNQGLTPLLATATMSMNNNTVQNCVLGGATSTTNSITAITNLSLPGTMNMTGNNVINNSITATTATTGIIAGISNSGAAGTVNINTNIIRGLASTSTSGQVQPISNTGAVVTALNINNNQLGNASGGLFSTSTATSGTLFGIVTSGGASTCALSIQTNDIRGITYSVAASAAHAYIQNSAGTLSQNISTNTFTNLTVNTTASATFISDSVTVPPGGTQTINSNSIVTQFSKTGAGGTIVGISSGGSSTTVTSNWNNNNFSNITVAGATAILIINQTDGGSVNHNITGNTISNIIGGTSSITGISSSFGGQNGGSGNLVSGNSISGISSAGAITAISIGSSGSPNLSTVTGNTINTLTTTGASAVIGITSSAPTNCNILKNKIYDLSGNNAGTTVSGIVVSAGTLHTIYNNLIGNLTASAATGSNAIVGINLTSTTTSSSINVYYNTVYLANPVGGVGYGSSGIFHTASVTPSTATLTLRNNIIVNTSVPNGGVQFSYLRSAGTAGSLANYASASNNNLFYAGTPGAQRVIYSDFVSTAQTITAYKNGVFTAGTIAPRDSASFTENPTFLSTTGSNANFLHISGAVPTQIESGGVNLAGITDDFDTQTRQGNVGYVGSGTAPDVGADEFGGIALDLTGPVITYTNLGNGASGVTTRAFSNVTITDASGVNTTSGTKPRLYYKKSTDTNDLAATGWKFVEANGTTSPFDFTINYAALNAGLVSVGDTIQYFVVAQDLAATPNVSINTGTFAATPASVALTGAAFPITGTINSYTIVASISGTKTVCASGCDYTSLTNALGVFADINAKVVTADTNIEINGDLPGETGLNALNQLAEEPAGSNFKVTIYPTNAARSITGSSAAGLITFNGVDNAIIDGSLAAAGIDRSLTITNTNAGTSSAVVWLQATAQNNRVKNLNVIGSGNTQTLFGIGSGSSTISTSSLGTGNNSNRIENNSISKTQYGIYSQGASAGSKNTGNRIKENLINAASPNNVQIGGIMVGFEDSITISQNNIAGMSRTSSVFGIAAGFVTSDFSATTFAGNEVTNATISLNKVDNITSTSATGFSGMGIAYASAATGTTQISNNMISRVSDLATSPDFNAGIYVGGGAGSLQIYHNSVWLSGNRGAATLPSFALAIGGSTPIVDIQDNALENNSVSTGAGKSYAIGLAYTSTVGNYTNLTSNNNGFFTSGTSAAFSKVGSLTQASGTDKTSLLAWQTETGRDPSPSFSGDPQFNSTSDVHIKRTPVNPSPVENVGTLIAAAGNDFDGDTRANPPDIGADEVMTVSFSQATYRPEVSGTNEGDTAIITVNRTSGAGAAATVNFTVGGGSATGGAACTTGVDYITPASLTLNFAAADTSKTFNIVTCIDGVYEGNETVPLTLASVSGDAIIGTQNTATVNIIDGQTPPTATIGDVSQNELNSGTSTFSFPVTLSGPSATATTINYTTADISATAGSDYVAATSFITIPALSTTGNILITVNGDTTVETNETFKVTITSPDVLIGGTGFGTGTIVNDDVAAPTLGNYPPTSIALGANTTVTPDAIPTDTTSISATTDSNFKGTLTGNPATGVVRVTNASPAGTYTVTVKAFGTGGTTTKTFTLTVTSGTACNGNTSFTSKPDVAGTDSWSLAVGDFNGDGKQDLASASVGLDSASIRLGIGDGTFSSSPEAPVGSHPQFVAVGDFNGDGKQDLVTANVLANTVSIRLGNGDGTFSGTNNPGVGSNPISIAVGDFNGDGKQDLAVANQGSTTVSIRLGNGDGTFSNVPDVSVQTTPDSVVVGDFNTDSILDLAVANYGSDTVSIRLGVGDGTFGGVNNVSVGSRPTGVVVGDFNGDTKQDIAAVNYNSNPGINPGSVSIRLGDGAGNFAITGEVPAGLAPYALAVADFNNDSKQDLVVTSQGTDAVSIRLGNGGGGFGGSQDVATTHGGESVVVGDFNADGKQDIANNIYFGTATPNGLASIRLGGCTPVVNLSVDTNAGTEAAATVVTVTATASDPVVGAQTVSLGVSGTNITGGDYTLSNSTITIPNGGTTGSVTFTVVDDAVYEGPETATLTISSPSSGIALGATTTQNVAITDNDTAPAFSINDLTQAEGNGGPGTTSYTFTITKTGATELNSSVSYETVDGTATSPSDFTAILTTNQVFLPADASKPVTVLVNGDTTFEANEAFSVLLTNASGATIADNSGTGTITNDDVCGAFATVYVDDDWVGTTIGTDPDGVGPATSFGCDSFATIQGGVNGVSSGGTVIVRAGTYPEAVLINKPLSLQGAMVGANANTRFAAFTGGPANPKANPAVESVITAAATAPTSAPNDTLHVMASNVTIDGFVIDGNNAALNQTGSTVIGGVNTDSRRAIQTEDAAGTPFAASNTQVKFNVIQNFAQRGVELINGGSSGAAPATTGSLITENRIRNFGLDGIVLAFNASADITNNTVNTNDYPTEAGIWVQDFLNTGTPYPINITNNNITVGQDNFGGIWANLAYLPSFNINNNTVNAAAGVVSGSDFTYGIYITSLRPGSSVGLNGNIVGSSGGAFDRGIALWNLGTPGPTTTTVTGGTVGNSVDGVSLHDNDPNFGLAGSNSAVDLSGVSISGTTVGVLVDALGSTGDTVAMQISGNTSISGGSTGISVTGANASANIHNNAASIHDNGVGINVAAGSATITSNNLFTNGTGLRFTSGATATAHFNRIISTTTAIDNANNLTPNLENNWWGCNAGPGNAGCGAVIGTGADFDPWIVLGVSAVPSSIGPGQNSTVTADMTRNSAGTTPVGTLPDMAIAWTATNGTMSPTSGTVTAGTAMSTFTSSNSSSGTACGMVDNQNTCTPIGVTLPSFSIDDVTHNEGNGGPGTTSYTFTITKTGAGAASVDYATVDGTATAPSDYTAIPTTPVSFLSADTTKQFTVFVNGDTAFEGNEAFTVHLSNASGATISDADGTGTITNDDACGAFATVYVDDSWVGTPLGSDPDGIGPATSFGCDSFATIQGGVTAVTAGGTVIVYDGTYTENVSITKAMTLKGNQFGVDARGRAAAESIVIPAAPGTATFTVAFSGTITIDGFSFSGGTSGAQGCIFTSVGPNNNMQISNNRFSGYSTAAIWMNRGGSDITIDKNVMDGSNLDSGGTNQTIFLNGSQSFAGINVTNNNIINNNHRYGLFVDGNNNVGESATRAALISANLFNNNLQSLNLGSRSFGKLGAPLLGAYAGTISNNTFSNNTANGIQAGIEHVLVSGNTFSGNAIDGLALTSFGNTAADRGAQNSLITGNTFTTSGRAGIFFSGTQGVGLIETNHANFNRIVGNAVGVQYGSTVATGNNATIDVENNWWGCNYGPGTGGAGCGTTPNGTLVFAGNSGVLDSDPWIVLGTSASPNPTTPGGNSTVTADMTKNSNGATPPGGAVPPMPVAWSATNGTMSPTAGTITAGTAMSTFTSNSSSAGTACAMVDNQQTCTPIGVSQPAFSIDDVTHLEGDPPGTTSYVFTVTKTGTTTLSSSVAFTTQDGSATLADNDYQTNSGTLNFGPTDTTMQITVLVNRDTNFEPNEAFNVHLSGAVNATISDADGAGTITNDDTPGISGHVAYDDSVTTFGKNVTMTLTGNNGFVTRTTTTDANGDYSFVNVPTSNDYTLTPSKVGDVGALHIESNDAAKAARFVAGLDVPTATQVIASDADGDGILTSFDAALIARYAAGLPNFGVVGTWKFVPVNRTFTALAANQSAQNFTAILVGDTDGNWQPALPAGGGDGNGGVGISSPQNPDAVGVTVALPNVSGAMLSTITVPITVGDVTGLAVKAYDLQVSFNAAIVQPDTTPTDTSGTLSSGMLITPNTNNPGHLIVSAFQTTDLAGSGTLIKLRFKIIGTPGQVTPTTFADYTDPGTIFHPGFRFNAGTPAAIPTNGSIHVNGPTAAAGTVSGRVTDETGRPVSGVVMNLNGTQSRKTITDADGNYRFDEVETGGFYTVTPSRANYGFSPGQRSFNQLGNTTDAVFTAVANGTNVNPLDTPGYFVRQQYLDFLGREPDEAGFTFWVNNIEACGADSNCLAAKRTDTSAAFFLSIEFQQTGYLVYRMYQSAYGDLPGTPVPLRLSEFRPGRQAIGQGVVVNQSGWEAKLEANKQAFALEFVQRVRFTDLYPTATTPAEFVDRLFRNAGVTPDGSDRAAAISEFAGMADTADVAARARAVRLVAENAMLRQQKVNQAFVLMQYFGYLGRDPNTVPDTDFSGYTFWLNKLDSFNGDFRNAEMVRAFLVAGEYRGRFPR